MTAASPGRALLKRLDTPRAELNQELIPPLQFLSHFFLFYTQVGRAEANGSLRRRGKVEPVPKCSHQPTS